MGGGWGVPDGSTVEELLWAQQRPGDGGFSQRYRWLERQPQQNHRQRGVFVRAMLTPTVRAQIKATGFRQPASLRQSSGFRDVGSVSSLSAPGQHGLRRHAL
jgi:hypothetical protein